MPLRSLDDIYILFISIMTDPFIIFISYMRTWKSKKVHYLSQLPPTALLPTTAAGGAEFAYLTCSLYFLFQT